MTEHTPDLFTEKQSLRKQMHSIRQAIIPADRLAAAQSIALHFADHPHLTYAKSFAGYYPMRGEMDVLPIFNRMTKFHKQMALPRIESDMLQFHNWQPGTALEDGLHGTKQPDASTDAFIPEVILIPLLAFDAQGGRLGYGGGYYDRTLAHLHQTGAPPLCIGVAFATQEVPLVPTESHDMRLDGILTEQGVSLFHSE